MQSAQCAVRRVYLVYNVQWGNFFDHVPQLIPSPLSTPPFSYVAFTVQCAHLNSVGHMHACTCLARYEFVPNLVSK